MIRIARDMKKSTHPVDKNVGVKLKNKRLEAGLSQEELGRAVGLTFQQIQKYERALNRISASKLFDFAQYLGVGISYFFSGLSSEQYSYDAQLSATGFAENENNNEFSPSLNEIDELIKLYVSISDAESRRKIIDLAEKLAPSNAHETQVKKKLGT
jgi:transcriptional regulator with XRE-family HTH domain